MACPCHISAARHDWLACHISRLLCLGSASPCLRESMFHFKKHLTMDTIMYDIARCWLAFKCRYFFASPYFLPPPHFYTRHCTSHYFSRRIFARPFRIASYSVAPSDFSSSSADVFDFHAMISVSLICVASPISCHRAAAMCQQALQTCSMPFAAAVNSHHLLFLRHRVAGTIMRRGSSCI